MQKKGSIELSIQAIVIIVIALTLLGLGVMFVRSQFNLIQTTGTEVQEQVREQITGQLRATGEKVSFPRDIKFSKNEQKVITMGIQNTGSQTIYFKLDITPDETNSDPDYDKFNLRYQQECLSLTPSESDVYGINVRAPSVPGTFALRANVIEYKEEACVTVQEGGPYATKLTFITVG